MKKIYLVLICFLLLPLISAEIQYLGTFKTDNCVTLKQTCVNCTYLNVSVTIPPSQLAIILNQNMTHQLGTNLWTFEFCNTSQNGEYFYDTFGDPDGISEQASVNFVINPIGKILTTAQATLYFLIFILTVLFFLLCAGLGLYLPSGNKRNEMTGYIIAVSNLKYVKMFIMAISYLLMVLIFYFGYIISYGYLDLDFLGNLFYFAFFFMIVLILPLFIVGSYVIIANAVRDHKVGEMLSRGLRIR